MIYDMVTTSRMMDEACLNGGMHHSFHLSFTIVHHRHNTTIIMLRVGLFMSHDVH